MAEVPTSALDAVLLKSVEMPEGTPTVKGYDFEGALDLQALLDSMLTSGFQATQFGYAVEEVNKMLAWRLSDEPVEEDDRATCDVNHSPHILSVDDRPPRVCSADRDVFADLESF